MRHSLIIVLIFLVGCATGNGKYDVPNDVFLLAKSIEVNSSYQMTGSAYPVKSAGEEFILASDFLYADTDVKNTSMSFFLFPKKPVGKKAKDKILLICEEWKASFPPKYEIQHRFKDVDIVPFYWLLNVRSKQSNCNALIENYDYVRSQQLARSLKLNNTRQYIVLVHNTHVVSMDISQLEKPEDISLSIETWKSKLTKFPKGDNTLTVVDFTYSAKAVLGALGTLIAMK